MPKAERLKTSYDRLADVLYVTVGNEPPRRYVEDDDGLVWRLGASGQRLGVTVQGYKILWAGKRDSLAERIAEPLHLTLKAASRCLPA